MNNRNGQSHKLIIEVRALYLYRPRAILSLIINFKEENGLIARYKSYSILTNAPIVRCSCASRQGLSITDLISTRIGTTDVTTCALSSSHMLFFFIEPTIILNQQVSFELPILKRHSTRKLKSERFMR